ncbi:MAG: penicillin-binding protein 2 [Deltaproteobacteria bacterium]|nr:penicillin-binding protein 2 [Deltaproteobacteria bacterium]
MSLNPPPEETPGLRRRFIISSLIIVGVFCVLALRLWYLQILEVDHYRDLSERNRIRYVAIQAPRGAIFDRHGTLLVDNRPAFTVSALRQGIDDRKQLFHSLGELLDVDEEQLEERWQAGQGLPRYRPLPLLDDVGRQAMEKVQENSVDLPGILVEVKPFRDYPYGEMAAHLFGYLGEVTEEELGKSEFAGYRSGEMVGKTALENMFEDRLRGTAGQKRIEVNVRGRELRQVTTRAPLPGQRLYLTIDTTLQQAAEKALADRAGAIVALDVNNGEILAFVSRPTFDPAWFARGITGEEWRSLVDNSQHPMTNKVLRGQYPPGSTFKMVVALAALEAGTATPSTRVQCNGSMRLGRSYEYRCWKRGGHGSVDLHKAIKESCDVWFYHVGLEAGIDRIASAAQRLGLGQKLGFPFGGERSGLIPNRAWKKKRFGTSWYDGETVISSIGQGFVLTTPLQLATMAATLANGGTVWRPQIVQKIVNLEGGTEWLLKPEKISETVWPAESLKAVKSAMESVVNDIGGTAWRSRLKKVRFAGKTGTAQVIKRKSDEEEKRDKGKEIPYQYRDHALFVSYAPVENPQIAVAVVVEHGGHGSSAAAPVAKAMYEAYFPDKTDDKDVAQQVTSGD